MQVDMLIDQRIGKCFFSNQTIIVAININSVLGTNRGRDKQSWSCATFPIYLFFEFSQEYNNWTIILINFGY